MVFYFNVIVIFPFHYASSITKHYAFIDAIECLMLSTMAGFAINCGGHWYMLVVDVSHGTASIWDSLESPSRTEKMINESLAIICS